MKFNFENREEQMRFGKDWFQRWCIYDYIKDNYESLGLKSCKLKAKDNKKLFIKWDSEKGILYDETEYKFKILRNLIDRIGCDRTAALAVLFAIEVEKEDIIYEKPVLTQAEYIIYQKYGKYNMKLILKDSDLDGIDLNAIVERGSNISYYEAFMKAQDRNTFKDQDKAIYNHIVLVKEMNVEPFGIKEDEDWMLINAGLM